MSLSNQELNLELPISNQKKCIFCNLINNKKCIICLLHNSSKDIINFIFSFIINDPNNFTFRYDKYYDTKYFGGYNENYQTAFVRNKAVMIYNYGYTLHLGKKYKKKNFKYYYLMKLKSTDICTECECPDCNGCWSEYDEDRRGRMKRYTPVIKLQSKEIIKFKKNIYEPLFELYVPFSKLIVSLDNDELNANDGWNSYDNNGWR